MLTQLARISFETAAFLRTGPLYESGEMSWYVAQDPLGSGIQGPPQSLTDDETFTLHQLLTSGWTVLDSDRQFMFACLKCLLFSTYIVVLTVNL